MSIGMGFHRSRLSALGVVSALGANVHEFRKRILAGDNNYFSVFPRTIQGRKLHVGEVKAVLPKVPEEFHRYSSRNFQLAMLALSQIHDEVSEAIERYGADRIAVVIGSSTSGIAVGERAVRHCLSEGEFPAGYQYSQQELGSVADGIRDYLSLRNLSFTVSTACSSSAKVFKSAKRLLQQGMCDAVIVGGVDSLCEMTLRGFSSLELTSASKCNPFSKNRDGITIGEGAALFLLEQEPDGVQLVSVGESSDAYHMSAPHPEGLGAAAAMQAALKGGGLLPANIAYLNLHGTGTPHNDSAESAAVVSVFDAMLPPCSSSKALFGHTLGASGALELAVCWAMMSHENAGMHLPMHVWDGERDDALPVLPLIEKSIASERTGAVYCMSNSLAFGGSNCSVVIGVH